MSAQSLVVRAQQQAEAIMGDACEVRAPDGKTLNTYTGQNVTTPGALRYSGKCRVQLRAAASGQDPVAGDRAMAVLRYEVHLPMTAAAASVDDVVTITASVDAELVGNKFRVSALVHKTYMSARRLIVEETQN